MSLTSIVIKSFDDLQNNRIKRLRLTLINYEFQLKYIPRESNLIRNFLSRINIETNGKEDLSKNNVMGVSNI